MRQLEENKFLLTLPCIFFTIEINFKISRIKINDWRFLEQETYFFIGISVRSSRYSRYHFTNSNEEIWILHWNLLDHTWVSAMWLADVSYWLQGTLPSTALMAETVERRTHRRRYSQHENMCIPVLHGTNKGIMCM